MYCVYEPVGVFMCVCVLGVREGGVTHHKHR